MGQTGHAKFIILSKFNLNTHSLYTRICMYVANFKLTNYLSTKTQETKPDPLFH